MARSSFSSSLESLKTIPGSSYATRREQVPRQQKANRIKETLGSYGIDALYHFTDRANLDSIMRHGLLSRLDQLKRGVDFVYSAATDTSRKIDIYRGYAGCVHLCFTMEHPLYYVALNEGRLVDPVWLKIPLKYLFVEGARACDRVATAKGAECFPVWEIPRRINLEHLGGRAHAAKVSFEERKNANKAEVLVPGRIEAAEIELVDSGFGSRSAFGR